MTAFANLGDTLTAANDSVPGKWSKGIGEPAIRRIANSELKDLQKQLSASPPRSDSYSQSAAYYAMTGRKGLWCYATRETFMLVARHPNRNTHLLLFPPFGKDPVGLLQTAIDDRRLGDNKIQLARLTNQDRLLLKWGKASRCLEPEPETLLDWKFPVHTLSTQSVAEHRGKLFRDFRKGVLRSRRNGLTARPIDNPNDHQAIIALSTKWAEFNPQAGYSQSDLTAPTRALVELIEQTALPINGIIADKSGEPAGFILWEETDPKNRIANSLGNIAIAGNGTSEFLYLAMCEYLGHRGFERVSIGGSESAGLDRFKRKMNPVASEHLTSAFVPRP